MVSLVANHAYYVSQTLQLWCFTKVKWYVATSAGTSESTGVMIWCLHSEGHLAKHALYAILSLMKSITISTFIYFGWSCQIMPLLLVNLRKAKRCKCLDEARTVATISWQVSAPEPFDKEVAITLGTAAAVATLQQPGSKGHLTLLQMDPFCMYTAHHSLLTYQQPDFAATWDL